MITIKVKAEYFLTDTTGLTGIELMKAYQNNSDVLNSSVNGIITKELINDAESNFNINDLKAISSIGGTVLGYKSRSYIKVDNLDAEVPNFMPNCMHYNYDEETGEKISERLKTWLEWVGKNYTISEIDGYYYFLNYSGDGKNLNNSTIIKLFDGGIELVDKLPQNEEI